MSGRSLHIVATGPLATVQDMGRPGYAHVGVGLSGAADRGALALANRLVGNTEYSAGIEVTMGGLIIRANGLLLVAVTGAAATVRINDSPTTHRTMIVLQFGDILSIDTPTDGLRTYLAVRGGINTDPVLGSRATDLLSGIGPSPLRAGDELPVGFEQAQWPAQTYSPFDAPLDHPAFLRAQIGPRHERISQPELLFRGEWIVDAHSDRVGVRLNRTDGDERVLSHRPELSEMASEGVALGSVQVPPSGQPTIFLADHPVTGGYPVIAVLRAASTDRAAQLIPGDRVRFIHVQS